MTTITLRTDREGERADAFLARSVQDLTRSAAQKLLEQGMVKRRGAPLKKNDRLSAGEELELTLPDPEPLDVVPQNIPLDVVYEDEDVIVVNKPVGLVVHPAPGHPDGTLVNALLYHCGDSLSGVNGVLRPGIVHRIDRDTSGLIIAAKNDRASLLGVKPLHPYASLHGPRDKVGDQAVEDLTQSGLPAAVVANDRQEVPFLDLKGDLFQGGLRGAWVGIGQAVDLNRVHLSSPQPFFPRSF